MSVCNDRAARLQMFSVPVSVRKKGGCCALSQSVSLLILHVNLDLVIDRVRSMLLVLRHWRLPRNYLHLHRARQKELLLLLLLLLVLKVDAVN